MPTKDRKRMYNPATGKYYPVRQRMTRSGRKGPVKSLWSPQARR